MLEQFDTNPLVTALMGASPRLFPDIDIELTRKNIGRIKIETVEDMQNQIHYTFVEGAIWIDSIKN